MLYHLSICGAELGSPLLLAICPMLELDFVEVSFASFMKRVNYMPMGTNLVGEREKREEGIPSLAPWERRRGIERLISIEHPG